MGLLGGFKGKLIGKQKKVKKVSTKELVCVRYSTFSEFEPNEAPSCSNGRTAVVTEKKAPVRPQLKNVFQNMEKKEVGVAAPKPVEKTPTKPQTKTDFAKVEKKAVGVPVKPQTKDVFAKVVKKEAPKPEEKPLTNGIKPTSNDRKAQPPPKKSAPAAPQSKKTSAPQLPPPKEPAPEMPKRKAPTPAPVKKPESFDKEPPMLVPSDDDGNFKIHIASNIANFDSSSDEDEDTTDMGSMNYSSQATSIFFGGEEEPVNRPRNVVLNDDDEDLSDGSSASA